MQITRRHWAAASLAAVLVHAGVALAVLWQPPESGAKSIGIGGIEVSLGPAGGAPGGEARLVEEIGKAETTKPDSVAAEPLPQESVAVPPDPTRQEMISPVNVKSVQVAEKLVPEEAVEPEPEPAPAKPIEEATTVEAVKARPVEAIEEQPPPPALKQETAKPVVAPPLPKRKPSPPEARQPAANPDLALEVAKLPRQEPAKPARPAEQRAAAVAPSAPGAHGKAGAQGSPDAGSANDTTGGGMPGEMADYMAQLQAWLEKHKEYPRRAQLRRQEGTALLYFVMDRDGRVLEYRLQQSSGHRLLDHEVMAMINRAKPLPKMPDDMRRSRLELVVPVQFFLK